MQIKQITQYIESIAPMALQESYDNAGLIIGNPEDEVSGALISLDITEEVLDEAIHKKLNLVICHHPIIFSGIKKLNGRNYIERCVAKAIKNDIAVYAAHTNLDSVFGGVNSKICEKLELQNCKILAPMPGFLKKLVTFVPLADAEKVRIAIWEAGAGHIGNYDSCSYNVTGEGTFRGNEQTNPYVGEKNQLHIENEVRIETIFPKHIQGKVVHALLQAHPYEEVAYDIYPLDNDFAQAGIGMIGELNEPMNETEFLKKLKDTFHCGVVKHTELLGKSIKSVAVCGGAGSSFLNKAIAQKADIFVSGDFKYHQFFDAERKIVIADIGHYESEQFTKEVFYELLTKKFPKFAVHLSATNTNPVSYFI
ncbi:MAG TPA: Nif3-like dinuclear metal center hexameric protein [Prolixibacteraceae bacterium]|nr:Nif3-like dinuclear metal center hexameric protein [Prolixibacteraceae bacterium]HPR86291.1 Nif3-like dinuclear metal center hexameric protein [Prolixibacteraceae bacterium]